jgi:NTE family protein
MDRRTLLGAGALVASAAASAAKPAARQPEAAPGKWALVLGGGTARGLAHIGVLKVLQQNGLVPDLVVGCSAGALVGSLYAAGLPTQQLEELALRVRDNEIADLVSGNKRGMVAGEALQAFVNRQVKQQRIEQFKLPFAALATNLTTGLPAVFSSGDAGLAVRASSSIPAIFIPTRIHEQEYVDGGLISPMPIRTARDLGASTVVAVTLNSGAQPANPAGLFELLMQSFEIMSSSITRLELREADVVVQPDLGKLSFTDFTSRHLMITLGEQAARRALPAIRSKLRLG